MAPGWACLAGVLSSGSHSRVRRRNNLQAVKDTRNCDTSVLPDKSNESIHEFATPRKSFPTLCADCRTQESMRQKAACVSVPVAYQAAMRALIATFPSASPLELQRFALVYGKEPRISVKQYKLYAAWKNKDGTPEKVSKALANMPPLWIFGGTGRSGLANDGSRVIYIEAARTDAKIPALTYMTALCGLIEDLVQGQSLEEENARITVLLYTAPLVDALNPDPWTLLPIMRLAANLLPQNYPQVMQRLVVYPVPAASMPFLNFSMMFLDNWVRERVCFIAEDRQGKFAEGLRNFVSKDSLPEHALSKHQDL